MADDWTWDETLFAGAAAHYTRGRLPYAPDLAPVLARALRLDGTGRLLDVGCGPGTLTLRLAHLFAEAVGVDPDPGVIAEARRLSRAAGAADRTVWVRARAEELPGGLGTFDVAVFGQSFHWMDQPLVAAAVRDLLRPGGALVHVADVKDGEGGGETRWPRVPYEGISRLVKEYLGPVRRAGRGVLPRGTPGGEREVFRRAGFLGPERHVVPGAGELTRGEDDVVAGVFSLSSSAPHLFGRRLGAFEGELRGLLRGWSPQGWFSERGPDTEVFVWHAP
ncbi:class I SAM-dependent methyltransferase [Streptomyces sp. DSM 110735]|uniref:class I SAM-dependent methyltransferase n=1 Tax=Streptomyces sp. DSM 110735 TaxID=2775031 RepID=UPI0018F511E4|nr:class I SAM-dependent methyltransferase [Streptomyces sp. DSM 110735]MBJ7902744.1 class I SAM-dependent methyltransferase [Streptomyces sp. DSM 110735]